MFVCETKIRDSVKTAAIPIGNAAVILFLVRMSYEDKHIFVCFELAVCLVFSQTWISSENII